MVLNGKRLKGVLRGLRKRRQRARAQEKEIKAVERKELFKARKKQALVFAQQKAKYERKDRLRKAQARKIGFAKALGFAKARGKQTKQGIATSIGIKRKANLKKPKIGKAKRKMKRKLRQARPDFEENDMFGGFGF